MFQKVFIANRSEIAIRVIRSCREMAIQTVAIYSDADRTSPHVLKADEAYYVGPPLSAKSYLNEKAIFKILEKSNADAVHPGYGFLSESPEFARAIQNKGITWIGPSAEVITTMGDKMAARNLAIESEVPVVPGTKEPIKDISDAKNTAANMGYPVLIKAAGGGGGKGMRIIHSETELKNSIERAKSEAQKAFSDDRVYLEKYLEDPHHIEIQIFADNHGNVVSLGERECSIQRRYQKIIEETPSPFIDDILRHSLATAALKITKACNYSGAGTVEFLVDKHKNYYFLEMNTRLQVEHPITEMVTDVDLVQEQIRVAAGKKLSFKQEEISPRGAAIECRIYAENGFSNFTPSTGLITEMTMPQGLGVRLDEGTHIGQEITPYYDPLLGKLITWGKDRPTALSRMIRALNEFHIAGIETNIPFCLMVFKHPAIKEGKYSTHTLDTIKDEVLSELNIHNEDQKLAARIGAIQFNLQSESYSPLNRHKTDSKLWFSSGRKDAMR